MVGVRGATVAGMTEDSEPDVPTALGPDGLITPAEAAARGLDGVDLRAACDTGRLVRVRFGVCTEAPRWADLDADGRYRLRVVAAGRRLRRPVFSHDSAAALWRLPRLGSWPAALHVVVPAGAPGRSFNDIRCHRVALLPTPLVSLPGVRATGAARTVVDVARSWSSASGLVVADHALSQGWTTRQHLLDELRSLGAAAGLRAARRVVAVASPLAESPGESLSRALMHDLGLPVPELRHVLSDGRGRIGRVDFWWPWPRTVGELEGRVTYRVDRVDDSRPPEDRLWAEKQREDRLRAMGLTVVRWTWADLRPPDRFGAALARAGVRPEPRPSAPRRRVRTRRVGCAHADLSVDVSRSLAGRGARGGRVGWGAGRAGWIGVMTVDAAHWTSCPKTGPPARVRPGRSTAAGRDAS